MESAHFRPHSIKSAHRHGSRSVQESAYTIETSTLPATFIVPLPRPTNSSCDRRTEKRTRVWPKRTHKTTKRTLYWAVCGAGQEARKSVKVSKDVLVAEVKLKERGADEVLVETVDLDCFQVDDVDGEAKTHERKAAGEQAGREAEDVDVAGRSWGYLQIMLRWQTSMWKACGLMMLEWRRGCGARP